MVRPLRASIFVFFAAGAAVVLGLPGAHAMNFGGSGDSGSTSGPSQHSSGTDRSDNADGCHRYATASSYGLTCYHGGGAASGPTVESILGTEEAIDFCWDEVIPSDELPRYGATAPADGADYIAYLHSCITGLDPNTDVYHQPHASVDQVVVEISKTAAVCPDGTPAGGHPVDATLDANNLHGEHYAAYAGVCIMKPKPGQRAIAGHLVDDGGQIPGITLAEFPSSRVRTNEAVAYQWVDGGNLTHLAPSVAGSGSVPTTQAAAAGNATMFAQLTAYKIYPYGPGNQPLPDGKACNGWRSLSNGDSPSTAPDACWWTYPRGSGDQPDHVYPFRAEADWTVYIQADGAAPTVYASFAKYADVPLPVYDIQTLVVN